MLANIVNSVRYSKLVSGSDNIYILPLPLISKEKMFLLMLVD